MRTPALTTDSEEPEYCCCMHDQAWVCREQAASAACTGARAAQGTARSPRAQPAHPGRAGHAPPGRLGPFPGRQLLPAAGAVQSGWPASEALAQSRLCRCCAHSCRLGHQLACKEPPGNRECFPGADCFVPHMPPIFWDLTREPQQRGNLSHLKCWPTLQQCFRLLATKACKYYEEQICSGLLLNIA